MRFRTLFLFLVLALTGLFALLNWQAFTAPTTLSLVFGTIEAPLGVIMLGVVFLLGAMCLAYLIYVQGSALMESRRHAKDMQVQRDLADKAEASRFTELREFMNAELLRVTQANDQLRAAMFTRLDEMERRQRTVMEQNANSLSSYIGELEDRMEHRLLHPEVARDVRDLPPPDHRR